MVGEGGSSVTLSPAIGECDRVRATPNLAGCYSHLHALIARGRFRAISRSARVVVVLPVTASIRTDPPNIVAGQSAELSWDIGGTPKTIDITPEIGTVSEKQGHRQRILSKCHNAPTLSKVVDSHGAVPGSDTATFP